MWVNNWHIVIELARKMMENPNRKIPTFFSNFEKFIGGI